MSPLKLATHVIPKLKQRMSRLGLRLGFSRDWYLITIAAGIGVTTACLAIAFIEVLHAAEHLSQNVNASLPWRPFLLPLMPAVGALLTGLLVHFLAREAKGHGVPEVMDAIYRKKSRIRPRVALVKSAASICTIGSGGSAGAEGPIVQIGSALGSGMAQVLKVSREHSATLLGCGAAAGIASVFNAPIAGVFFVLEILLRDFSLRTFTPIVVSAVFSTAATQAYYQQNDAIFAPSGSLAHFRFTYPELPSYLVLGLICGGLACVFIRLLDRSEEMFDRLRVNAILKPVIGAIGLGVIGIAFLLLVSRVLPAQHTPAFFGNGYETIRGLLNADSYTIAQEATASAPAANDAAGAVISRDAFDSPAMTTIWMLLGLMVLKGLATSMTLGSGGSGGVFAPSLFVGATAGAAFGVVLETLGLIPTGGSPAAYALVGMAAMVAGTTHAPLTAILLLFELTRDVYVLLPIMLSAVVATVSAQVFLRDSIYTLKLRRRGVLIGTTADLTILRRMTARDIAPVPPVIVRPNEPLSKLLELRDAYKVVDFIAVAPDGSYLGMVTSQDMSTALIEREAIPYLLVEELVRRDLPTIDPEETLDSVLEKFSKHDVSSLPLIEVDAGSVQRVTGLVTRARLMHRYQQALAET